MPNSPYYDPKLLLLEHDLDKELIQQTLELFEFICGDSDLSVPQDRDLQQMFVDVLDKYRDSETISIDSIKERIAEQGYLYLTEIFDVTDENLRILASYLPMIQILKGTKPGLELIFTILNVGFEIKEWWEDPTNLEILSYILFVELINQPVSTQLIPRLRKFSREYVYPLLANITYAITYKLNKTPHIGAVYYSRTALTVWQEFLWLIWSGDSAPENLWTDQIPYQDPITHKSYWQGSLGEELEWDPKTGELTSSNTWSSDTDENDIRVWKLNAENFPTDGDLLEWWIEKINLFGKPEESWCTEDSSDENPIITYWSPDTETNIDGTLVKLTIIANPTSALVEINGELTNTANVKKGVEVSYRVYDPEGNFLSNSGKITPLQDTILSVSLTEMIPNCTFTLSVLPSDAKIELSTEPLPISNEEVVENAPETQNEDTPQISSITVKRGATLYWRVSKSNYYPQSGELVIEQDTEQSVTLQEIPWYTLTINPTPSNAIVKIDNQTVNTVTVKEGTKVTWNVSATNYVTQSGFEILESNVNLDINLELVNRIVTVNYTPVIAANINATATSGKLISNTRPTDTSPATITAQHGSIISYTVTPKSSTDYLATTGSFTADADKSVTLALDPTVKWYCYTSKLGSPGTTLDGATIYLYLPANWSNGARVYSSNTGIGGVWANAVTFSLIQATSSAGIGPATYYYRNRANPVYATKTSETYIRCTAGTMGWDSVRYPSGDLRT